MFKTAVLTFIIFIASHALYAQEWHTSFEEAKATAKAEGINIVLVFQGSDWCAPCIKLDKEIWSTSTFQGLAKEHFVMLKADFPRRKGNQLPEALAKQNAELAERYNSQGYFPFVVVLNPSGKVLGQMGYEKTSPEAYFKKLKSFERP